jgi:hypothetical protein
MLPDEDSTLPYETENTTVPTPLLHAIIVASLVTLLLAVVLAG